jgi:glycosyltransferase involved in cell wall biosynthesis/GT2 family glycosyltransferase
MPVSHPAPPALRWERFQAWLRELGYEPVVVGERTRTNANGYLAALRLLASAPTLALRARRERPQLVFAGTALNSPALWAIDAAVGRDAVFVADVLGIRSIETEQTTSRAFLRPPHRWLWRLLERLLFRQADLALAVNDRHAELVRALSPRVVVATVRCGAETELLELEPADRVAAGIPRQRVAVGFLGSLVCSRLEPVFAAWHELDQAAPENPLCLVVIGDGPDFERYRRRAAEQGWLGSSVVFLGGLPRCRALRALRACDIAYSECWSDHGFPTKVYEYLALGRPVVVEDKAQMREVLRDGHDALFFRTPIELAGLLARLAADPELRERLGSAGRETFRGAYRLDQQRDEFAAALLELHAGARGARGTSDDLAVDGPAVRREPRVVSVVVPILNAAATIDAQLAALACQSYRGDWELVVADNGSSDGSAERAAAGVAAFASARVVDASRQRGPGHARNQGARAANGDLLVFCDADDIVSAGWLTAMVDRAANADVVAGSIDLERLNDPTRRSWHAVMPRHRALHGHGFLPFASGCNCAVWRDVFEALGGFDGERPACEDVDLSWRAQLAGHRFGFAADAVVHKRLRRGLGEVGRQHFRWGREYARLFRQYRSSGMSRSSMARAAGAWTLVVLTGPLAVFSAPTRGRWVRITAERAGRASGSLSNRVLYL